MEKPKILSCVDKSEYITKVPLVELAGYKRVLIENHLGVIAYAPEEIQIKVSYGRLSVDGQCLKFIQIDKNQLVITGQIDGVKLFRG